MDIRPPRKPANPPLIDSLPPPLLPATVPAPQPPAPEQPQPRKNRTLWWLLGAAVVLLLAMASTVGWYLSALSPVDRKDTSRQLVTLEPGISAGEVAGLLKENDLIRDQTAFRTYIELRGVKSQLRAGMYKFSKSQSVSQIVDDLVQGRADAFNVTILPGETLSEIKDTLIKAGFGSEEIDAAFTKKYNHPLLASKPDQVNLEGYIYPETYQIDSSSTVESLLTRSFDEFSQDIKEKNLEARLAERGMSLHDAVILASIIQEEVADPQEQRQVAQVFHLRLSRDMPLGSDPTFKYGAQILGERATPSLDSPYNTRIVKGLPPSAIANFNLSALEAVADPAPGDYLYFVSGDDGRTYFSRTEEEHVAKTKEVCTTLCQ